MSVEKYDLTTVGPAPRGVMVEVLDSQGWIGPFEVLCVNRNREILIWGREAGYPTCFSQVRHYEAPKRVLRLATAQECRDWAALTSGWQARMFKDAFWCAAGSIIYETPEVAKVRRRSITGIGEYGPELPMVVVETDRGIRFANDEECMEWEAMSGNGKEK